MKNLWVLGIALLTVTACSKTKEQFDFSKKAPDEFQVTTRAPLEMPPEFTLRPPRPGAPRPQENSATVNAQQAIFGTQVQTATVDGISQGESLLLQKSNATVVDANIRDKVDAESAQLAEDSKSTVDRILGKAGKKANVKADVIDPIKEAERLKQQQQ